MTQYIEHIDLLLGDPKDRYFAEGFRYFNTVIQVTEIDCTSFRGHIQYEYDGPPRPRNEKVHIGSIEYLATTLYVGQIALSRFHHLPCSAHRYRISTGTYFANRLPPRIRADDAGPAHPHDEDRSGQPPHIR